MSTLANNTALFFTVAMLMVTAYFFLGSVPLLVLKHDDPVDAKFVRAFYNMYYRIALVTATGAALSYGFSGRPGFATGAAANALLVWWLRGTFIPRMVALAGQIQSSGSPAVTVFRRMHKTAILINLAQLVIIVASLGFF
jgi:hypothetical protein